MSFPDNPDILRTPRNFALRVLDAELDEDEISRQLSNLLGFAKNFYLQFFEFEFDIRIRNLDRDARRAVRPVERRLRNKRESLTELRLISHFVTLVKFLEEDETTEYDAYDLPDRRRRILEDIAELLTRILQWSKVREDLARLANQASSVVDDFGAAIEWIDRELGYNESLDDDE